MAIFFCGLLFCIIHKWYDCIGQCLLFALFTNIGTRDVRETFFASVMNQREIDLKRKTLICTLFWFFEKIQKLMLIENTICWVFLIDVFEVGLRSSLIAETMVWNEKAQTPYCSLWNFMLIWRFRNNLKMMSKTINFSLFYLFTLFGEMRISFWILN
jgi:hypothetical protein